MFAGLDGKTSTVPEINKVTYASKLSDEPVLVQTFSVAGKEESEVKNAIWKSATKRSWTVDATDSGDIEAKLKHRGSESTLTFKVADETVKIYSVSYKINKKTGERITRSEPEGWIRNLHKDILVNLGMLP